jgi:hypothetical protein
MDSIVVERNLKADDSELGVTGDMMVRGLSLKVQTQLFI